MKLSIEPLNSTPLLLMLWLLCFAGHCHCLKDIYISQNGGHDQANCGSNLTLACLSLSYAFNEIYESGDTMFLDAGVIYQQPYVYYISSSLYLYSNLTIIGLNGKPVITAHKSQNWLFSGERFVKLIVDSIKLERISLFFSQNGAELIISNSVFHCDCFQSNYVICFSSGYSKVNSYLTVTNSEFVVGFTAIYMSINEVVSLVMHNVSMLGCSSFAGGTQLDISTRQGYNSKVIISNSTFNNLSWYSLSIERSFAFVMYIQTIHISNSSFINCYQPLRFLSISSVDFIIHDCTFFMNTGSGIYVEQSRDVIVSNCSFIDNRAESGGGCYVDNSSVTIQFSVFLRNSVNHTGDKSYRRSSQLWGYGGAIMNSDGSYLTVSNCIFHNNSAEVFGGTIYHADEKTYMILEDSHLIGPSELNLRAFQGNLIYSTALAEVRNCTMISQSRINSSSLAISHASLQNPIIIQKSFMFPCAYGQNTNVVTSESAFQKSVFNLFLFYCEPCLKGQYTLDHGFAYILENSNVTHVHSPRCLPCPPGGACSGNSLRSAANFWGSPDENGNVAFLPCPFGYCCLTEPCQGYNSCSVNRMGRLCGSCSVGYGESLLSSMCVATEECSDWPLVVFAVVGCILYLLALMYLSEMMNFLKRFLTCTYCIKASPTSLTEPLLLETSNERCLEVDLMDNDSTFHAQDESSAIVYNSLAGTDDRATNQATPGKVAGMLKIIVFFYQAQLLIKVPNHVKWHHDAFSVVKEAISSVLNLKLTGKYYNGAQFCAIPDLGAVSKQFLSVGFSGILFWSLLVMWCCWKFSVWIQQVRSGSNHADRQVVQPRMFHIRIVRCLLQIILFCYATIATCSLILVACVSIQNGSKHGSYLYINAEIQCYQKWQYAMIAFVVLWTVPFFISLYWGSVLFRRKYVNLREYFILIMLPPMLIFFGCRWYVQKSFREISEEDEVTREEVLLVLEEPFRKAGSDSSQCLNWECVLIARRLILVSIYTFTTSPVLKLYLMAVPLVVYLIQHLRMQPFNQAFLNWSETISLTLLLLLNSINLFWAYNYIAVVPEVNFIRSLAEVLMIFETLILLAPFIGAAIFLCYVCVLKCSSCCSKLKVL